MDKSHLPGTAFRGRQPFLRPWALWGREWQRKGGFLFHYLIQWIGLLSLCDLKHGPQTRADASLVLLRNTETTSPRNQWTRICRPRQFTCTLKCERHCLLSQWGKLGVTEVSGVCSQQHLVQMMELSDGKDRRFRGVCGEVAWTEDGSMDSGASIQKRLPPIAPLGVGLSLHFWLVYFEALTFWSSPIYPFFFYCLCFWCHI